MASVGARGFADDKVRPWLAALAVITVATTTILYVDGRDSARAYSAASVSSSEGRATRNTTVVVDGIEYYVGAVTSLPPAIDEVGSRAHPRGKWVGVAVTITNPHVDDYNVGSWGVAVVDDEGVTYAIDRLTTQKVADLAGTSFNWWSTVRQGTAVAGKLYFDVPREAHLVSVRLGTGQRGESLDLPLY
ncbi:DUF4352 domain-containing protein [Micrococcales bacterium 31B]|nr:DUF4352 domain-containing protein [Micrococcales bacterium 31B]